VTLASAIIVVTCSTAREHSPPPASPQGPSSAAEARDAPAPPSSAAAAPPLDPDAAAMPAAEIADAAADAAAAAAGNAGHELDRFYAALRDLDRHARADHVRVEWLGDSHGASDLWSGALRSALQKRFGNGGPGYIHVGHKGYRHDNVKMDIAGKWRPRPKGPSTVIPTGDGVFGLAGFLMIGQEQGPRAILTVTAQDPPLPPALSWDFCYKTGTSKDEITIKLTGEKPTNINAGAEPKGAIHHALLHSSGADPTLTVTPKAGFPEMCGVIAEADPKVQPGVVLDEMGINGARLGTPLAWNEASWVSELARRSPSLVILEYGTNESGDFTVQPALYVTHLKKVMDRVHAASASCDCLVLAPTDRGDTLERTPLVRDALKAAAKEVGCRFWDTYEVMGGKASILAWRAETPPRAGPDGIHLNAKGYRELGEKLAAEILGGYTP
jgi:lysophospholipase L1-like esterase